jgi:hypothetical protein
MTLHAPDRARVTVQYAQPAIGTGPLTVRRRRGAYRLAAAARCAVGSNRGRIDDPA